MISECMCLSGAVEVSKEVVNGSFCIVLVCVWETGREQLKTQGLHVLSLPSFCLVRMITVL